VLRTLCQRGLQFVAGADAELGEYLAQVPFDRARAEEQLGADLRVRQAVAGEPGDLLLWDVSWPRVSAVRLRTLSPVAVSSRPARSANAAMPIASSIWWAVLSCARASTRRPPRRSHSP
jgi:hypothetical protein